jgi:hypothetical protein
MASTLDFRDRTNRRGPRSLWEAVGLRVYLQEQESIAVADGRAARLVDLTARATRPVDLATMKATRHVDRAALEAARPVDLAGMRAAWLVEVATMKAARLLARAARAARLIARGAEKVQLVELRTQQAVAWAYIKTFAEELVRRGEAPADFVERLRVSMRIPSAVVLAPVRLAPPAPDSAREFRIAA